ncbi:MAG TPA: SGNH/GDSL hydrolase family protein [Thermoleophilaceae bacterium]|jgi:lysophospholipase L1-like esterase
MDAATQIPEAERLDPHVLSPEEASELLAGHPWSSFVLLGDSIAKGVGDPSEGYRDVTFGDRVAEALASARPGFRYVNLAERQLKAAEVRDSQLDAAVELKPDLAGVIAGGNDMFVDVFDPAPAEAVLDEIVSRLAAAGATVMTFEVLDLPGAFGDALAEVSRRLDLLHEAVRRVAQRHGTIHVDAYTQPWSRDRDCMSADYQHATMRGQALAASATIRALGEHLRR